MRQQLTANHKAEGSGIVTKANNVKPSGPGAATLYVIDLHGLFSVKRGYDPRRISLLHSTLPEHEQYNAGETLAPQAQLLPVITSQSQRTK